MYYIYVFPINQTNVVILFFSLKPTCTDGYGGLWLGATDITTEGTFIWELSGKPITYSNWSINKPDDASQNEDCLHMWCKNGNGEWNDWPCNDTTKPQTSMCEVIFPCN